MNTRGRTQGINRRQVLASSVAAGAAVAGLTMPGGSKGVSAQADTIIGGKLADFTTFDPWFIVAANRAVHRQVFNGLVFLTREGTIEPSLAESWSLANENRTLTMTLRPGVKFHNGRELVADDIVLNIERAKNPDIGHALSGAASVIEGATAIDGQTVEITYSVSQPEQVILEFYDSLFIIAPEAMEGVATNPVGTGPYQFSEWVAGDHLVLEQFPDYWKDGFPLTPIHEIRTFADAGAMILNFQGGELDWISDPPYVDRQGLNGGDSQVLTFESLGAFWNFSLNVAEPPFDQKAVRQALAYATNREVIAQNVFFGGARAVSTPFFREEDALFDQEQADRYTFDLDAARQLLTDAGVTDLELTANSGAGLAETGAILQIVQADLAELGVTMNIEILEGAVFSERWLGGDFIMMSSAQAVSQRDLSALFDTVASFRADDNNNTHWADPTYRELAAAAKTELDPVAREDLYRQLRDIIVEESWVIPIATRPIAYATRTSLTGFDTSVSDFLMLEGVTKED